MYLFMYRFCKQNLYYRVNWISAIIQHWKKK